MDIEHTDNARLIMRVMESAQHAIKARFVQHLLPHRLTMPQFKTLQHLYWHSKQGGLTIGELSEHLGLANSTVSGIIDRLQRDGWTRRVRSKIDRRKIEVALTDKAVELFKQAPKDAEDFWQSTIGRLSYEEQEELVEYLQKLKNVMEKPTWPSYEQLHLKTPERTRERIIANLEEIFQAELNCIGRRLVLAKMAEGVGKSEVAAYLNQAASEEIEHALYCARLLGRSEDMVQNLKVLVKEEVTSQGAKEDLAKIATEEKCADILDFLSKTAKDESKHRRWFEDLLRQIESL